MAARKGKGGALQPAASTEGAAVPATAPAVVATDPASAAGGAETAPVAADAGAQTAAGVVELPVGAGLYPVLSPLRFDGRLYQPDDPDADVVTMTEDQAGPLQPLGVLGDRLD